MTRLNIAKISEFDAEVIAGNCRNRVDMFKLRRNTLTFVHLYFTFIYLIGTQADKDCNRYLDASKGRSGKNCYLCRVSFSPYVVH
jgi:hypothetical protein